MILSDALAELAATSALLAFAVAGGLSLLAGVEPLYAVLRGIGASAAVFAFMRWVAGLFAALGDTDDETRSGENHA